MSKTIDQARSGPQLFKWVCLLVAVIALSAFGWMLNDVRLEVKSLAPKVEKLTDKAEQLVEKTDKTLPGILTQTEQASKTVNANLPTLLERSEALLGRSEDAVGHLARLGDGLERYQELMGVVHAGSQDKGMLAYGNSILDFLGKQKATVGVKPQGPGKGLKHPVAAKDFATAGRKELGLLSVIARTKEEMLDGIARTRSAAPLYVQLGEEAAPLLLSDWLRQNHPPSKGAD